MKIKLNVTSRYSLIALAVGALCLSGSAFAADPSAAPKDKNAKMAMDEKDKDFMMEAGKGGMDEVAMGKMAEKQGQSSEVKDFGKRMVTDHSKANKELMALAKKKGVTLDTSSKPEKMSDSDFDKSYMDEMVKDHEKDVAAFEKEAKNGQDADVKAWAKQTLPTLKSHLKMAKEVQKKVDSKKS